MRHYVFASSLMLACACGSAFTAATSNGTDSGNVNTPDSSTPVPETGIGGEAMTEASNTDPPGMDSSMMDSPVSLPESGMVMDSSSSAETGMDALSCDLAALGCMPPADHAGDCVQVGGAVQYCSDGGTPNAACRCMLDPKAFGSTAYYCCLSN